LHFAYDAMVVLSHCSIFKQPTHVPTYTRHIYEYSMSVTYWNPFSFVQF